MTLGLVAAARHDWATAAEAYERAATADDIPMSWLGLAQARLELGAPAEDVTPALERALRIGTAQPAVAYAAAHLYDRLGQTDRADELYATALADLPSLAADPTWTSHSALAFRWPAILARAQELAPGSAWELALMAGDPDEARALAAETPGLPDWTLSTIDAWQGDQAAHEEVVARADANPDTSALAWATRLAARAGDTEAAEHYGRLLAFASPEGGTIAGQEVRVEPARWLKAVPAGTVTWYAGQWLYRRPTTADLIPPGLPRLVYVDPLAGLRDAEPDPGRD
jgi:tetratricopeptide (TPR) repeat protein